MDDRNSCIIKGPAKDSTVNFADLLRGPSVPFEQIAFPFSHKFGLYVKKRYTAAPMPGLAARRSAMATSFSVPPAPAPEEDDDDNEDMPDLEECA